MSQFYVICFDVCDKKRLRQVAIQMQNFGQRVQCSIFECYLDSKKLKKLKGRLESIINSKEDHIRYYSICEKDKAKILIDGHGTVQQEADYHLL